MKNKQVNVSRLVAIGKPIESSKGIERDWGRCQGSVFNIHLHPTWSPVDDSGQ